jgi:serine/threonine protein kinase
MRVDGYEIVKPLKIGGWSNIYLIIDEGETDEDFLKVLKVPSQNMKGNDNVERIISKYGSVKQALAEITREEKRINSKTSSTSTDRFKNFHYRPLPQFFDMKIVDAGHFSNRDLALMKIRDVMTIVERERKADEESVWARRTIAYNSPVFGLIYEYIRGCTFDEFFASKRSEAETVSVFAKAAYALNYIHTKGFTHNDLKGDNVMVGENGNVYILDLAFSRFEESESTIKGVRVFTAPERILGGTAPTKKADQYALGIMMYKAIVGKTPLSYEDASGDKREFARRVFRGELKPDFSLLHKKASPALCEVIERCLAFNPEDRYASSEDVEESLVGLAKSTGY